VVILSVIGVGKRACGQEQFWSSRRLLPGRSDLETWFGLVVGPGSCLVGLAHGFDLSFLYDRLGTLHGKHTRNKGER
jgi:hypothetical protein